MSDTSARDWRLYVSDMAMIAENVLHYTSRMTQSQFVADRKAFDATVRNLELIGEAAGSVPEPVRAANSHIPWQRKLLAAVPIPDPARKRARAALDVSELPSPMRPHDFQPPARAYQEVSPGHRVMIDD